MKIIAHRGASYYAPENTLPAFELAVRQGADGIEMDVHMTKDEKLVVIHDPSTGRTGTRNFRVSRSKFSTLRRVDVGSWFDPKYKGQKIVLLEDVLRRVNGKELYIELKPSVEALNPFCQLLDNYRNLAKKIVIISFHYELVSRLKQIFENFRILWIVQFGVNAPVGKGMYRDVLKKVEAAKLDGIASFAEVEHCSKMARDIRKNGWLWNVWTVDNPHLARQFMHLGVVSLTTNRPDWIRQHLSV